MTNDPAQPGDARLEFPAEVARGRLIAVLPSAPASSLMAPVEVMIQERIRAFSLPAHDVELRRALLLIFGARACFGVHGHLEAQEVAELADDGQAGQHRVDFVLGSGLSDDAIGSLHEAGVPVADDALTPGEVRHTWSRGLDAVQVIPADMASASYGQTLGELAPGVPVIARGGVGSYAVRRWLESGALAVCGDDSLVGGVVEDANMNALRERCRGLRAVVDDVEA
ncbi:bifunctional 4-hydroxy-2-oxoglutarate aldolase/2-dehydro-3-deoxy-phosphogluconate aldolase [Cutibacterium granulosum]|uniref:bifunctional 4-hydroxy-2-oxoglutarate aldolase/2-dehydro-3-deoxy-phosphogluconate aldolase n=1 Tax=Cutibacterium granulosum TaxID=33011 RepID=UPI002B22602D|nr:bifunctional 4-hydroxy-2-oxoglutarate aldolase/2-dehydro-3-deoxy-phosphogluconate aldolase [Cutibacterium granulosum]MEA5649578.1 bifunctional 4-hydroxy-2-oxoglutarate aldolase/2-dehydro-3-deoxy-phosphogluconate aldolase [Cutibacterium granulosum]